jgi:hypothetical protein
MHAHACAHLHKGKGICRLRDEETYWINTTYDHCLGPNSDILKCFFFKKKKIWSFFFFKETCWTFYGWNYIVSAICFKIIVGWEQVILDTILCWKKLKLGDGHTEAHIILYHPFEIFHSKSLKKKKKNPCLVATKFYFLHKCLLHSSSDLLYKKKFKLIMYFFMTLPPIRLLFFLKSYI